MASGWRGGTEAGQWSTQPLAEPVLIEQVQSKLSTSVSGLKDSCTVHKSIIENYRPISSNFYGNFSK
jgi:hypothetical protein